MDKWNERRHPTLTEDQLDAIAERVADRVIERVAERIAGRVYELFTEKAFASIGKSVFTKFLWALGTACVGLVGWLKGSGRI